MSPGRIAVVVVGCLLGTVGLAAAAGGAAAAFVHVAVRDDDGFFRSDEFDLRSETAAVTSERVDLASDPRDAAWVVDRGALGTIALDVRSADPSRPLFAGIGPSDEVDAYLRDVARDRVVDFDEAGRMEYERLDGERRPTAPGEASFWVARTESSTATDLTWAVDDGDWTVVVMNADGTPGVDVRARVGIKVDWIVPIAIVLLIVAVLLLAVGTVLAVVATNPRPRRPLPPPTRPTTTAGAVPS